MKELLVYIIFAYLAVAVQGTLFHVAKPDIVLILVCFFALKQNYAKGMAYGAFTGLLLDVSAGFILGPNIIGKMVSAFLARTVRENIFQWNIIISTIMVFLLSVLDMIMVYACYEVFSKVSFANRLWSISAAGTFLTAVFAMILFRFFNRKGDAYVWINE